MVFGDPAWTDYDFEVEAQRVSGQEGFGVGFRVADPRGKVLLDACRLCPVTDSIWAADQELETVLRCEVHEVTPEALERATGAALMTTAVMSSS